jgi:hypothetical protein
MIRLKSFLLMLMALLAPALAHALESNSDSFALIITNSDYQSAPSIPYAKQDGEAIRNYLIKAGYRASRIKMLHDQSSDIWKQWLGTEVEPTGALWREMRKVDGDGNVFVFYSGHGIPSQNPASKSMGRHLLPITSSPSLAYDAPTIDQVRINLKDVKSLLKPGRSLTLMVDSCFSGRAENGELTDSKMAFAPEEKAPATDDGIIMIAAGQSSQIAFWDDTAKRSLLTENFLRAVSGKADEMHDGNKDGSVSGRELRIFLEEEVLGSAQKLKGKDQNPDISRNIDSLSFARIPEADAPSIVPQVEAEPVEPVQAQPVTAQPTETGQQVALQPTLPRPELIEPDVQLTPTTPATPEPPQQRNVEFQEYKNFDFDGFDIAWHKQVFNVADCARICQRTDGCVAFTWNIEKSVCIAKSGVGPAVPRFDAVSGVRADSGLSPTVDRNTRMKRLANVDYTNPANAAADYDRFPAASVEICEQACLGEAQCRYYTYNISKRICLLKESFTKKINNSNAISGRK